ncbi:hypothetical protein A7982_12900 [Minicystis rosea]|nr:hypothetical protein A7982_12900 [Minicystis rosea]
MAAPPLPVDAPPLPVDALPVDAVPVAALPPLPPCPVPEPPLPPQPIAAVTGRPTQTEAKSAQRTMMCMAIPFWSAGAQSKKR